MAKPSLEEELNIFEEGTVDLLSKAELKKKLESAREKKRPLRIKYGVDPTSSDLHLGHTVPLKKLRTLQDLGHTIVFLIGDFTARIGDPSQQSETRKMLSEAEVRKYAETYQKQVFRILDKAKTEVVYNNDWFGKMSPSDFMALASRYTVARLLERDDFKQRFESRKPIAVIEFLYPLMQGYDSVVLKSDIELGGSDQKFNLLVGRELQRDYGQEPQVVMTLPILEGTDGVQKMSKSLGNAISIQDTPKEMFGKIMSIPDALMFRYFQYAAGASAADTARFKRDYDNGVRHPKDLKVELAKNIVRNYHNGEEAERAHQDFERVFSEGGIPEDLSETVLPAGVIRNGKIDILSLLQETGLVTSKSEARRLIQQGGVKINQKRVDSDREEIVLTQDLVIQCGKRKFAKVKARG